jgi:hypothetical protein
MAMRSQAAWLLVVGLMVQQAPEIACAQGAGTQERRDLREFSCAAFPGDLSEAGLMTQYGREHVIAAPVVGSDDGPSDGTVVFPDQEDLKLEIVWWDPESKTKMHWVRTRGRGRRWEAPNGITVGMDLKAIERANGWPFRLRGFTGEGDPGRIVSWGVGRLMSLEAGNCMVNIFLLPSDATAVDPLLSRQLGRGEFSSGHPAMQALNPEVYQMIVWRDWR